ncbi:MMPL family transporter [Agilicoccus flavus]|uniref:MMPL family transporter n=1 Tax=Agilicoccus flavus TaxID=2775968 RepID=UPI001CF62A6A|nr:MMPL family transporter [Agilicoccus flavus]
MSSALFALGRAARRRPGQVLAAWLLLIALLGGAAGLSDSVPTGGVTAPGSAAQDDLEDLAARFPETAGATAPIVVRSTSAALTAPARAERLAAAVDRLDRIGGVAAVTDPVAAPDEGGLAADGRTALVTVRFDDRPGEIPSSTLQAVTAEADRLRADDLQVLVGGVLDDAPTAAIDGATIAGTAAAALALALLALAVLGSPAAAAAGILAGFAAAGVTVSVLLLAAAVSGVPGEAVLLGGAVAFAAGLGASLALLVRYRENLRAGLEPDDGAGHAASTAGTAVVLAGAAAVVGLLATLVVRVPFLGWTAAGAALGIVVALAAALTLGPACMPWLRGRAAGASRRRGPRPGSEREAGGDGDDADGDDAGGDDARGDDEDGGGVADEATGADAERAGEPPASAGSGRERDRAAVADGGPDDRDDDRRDDGAGDDAHAHAHDRGTAADPSGDRSPVWARAAVGAVVRRPLLAAAGLAVLLGLASAPARDLSFALPDDGMRSPTSSAGAAHDMVVDRLGPGWTGPLLVVADVIASDSPTTAMDGLADRLRALPGVAHVGVPLIDAGADTGVLVVVPTTGPADPATARLVSDLRARADTLDGADDLRVRVTGDTAVRVDAEERLTGATPALALLVLALAFLVAFVAARSVVVGLIAALGLALSAAVAGGAVAAALHGDRLAAAFGLAPAGPVSALFPVVLPAALLAPAVAAQLLLGARVRERFDRHHDARAAAAQRAAAAAPALLLAGVGTALALAAAAPAAPPSLRPLLAGLAVGVAVDALLVRLLLAPAVLALAGRAAWTLPPALAARLPRVDLEGVGVARRLAAAEASAAAPDQVVLARGVEVSGPLGPVVSGLDLRLDRGQVCALTGPEGSGKTSALLALAGRMQHSRGDLEVAGAVLPEQTRVVRARVGLAELPTVNPLDDEVDVRQHIAERLATRLLLPWSRPRDVDAVLALVDEAYGVGLRVAAEDGARHAPAPVAAASADASPAGSQAGYPRLPDPVFVDPAAGVGDLSSLLRTVLGIVLAEVGEPDVIVVDDVDALRSRHDRVAVWAVLGWLARTAPSRPAVVAACQDPPAPADLTRWTGLPAADVVVARLRTASIVKVNL